MAKNTKTTMVFGTFDLLHEGHRFFLEAAKKHGKLVVVVARDQITEKSKGRKPHQSHDERVKCLMKLGLADEIVLGDENEGSWDVLKKISPHIISLGYDQKDLEAALIDHVKNSGQNIELKVIPAHHPDKYKSSLVRKHKNGSGKIV